jgi:ABC-type glycerol-3-phosphate transport system substrate-binding protein
MSKFQIITIAIFVLCIIGGVIAFATYKGSGGTTSLPTVTIWGTFPENTLNQHVASVNVNGQIVSVRYTQFSPGSFSTELISALARGQGPDAILVPADILLPHEDKLTLIPYSAFPQRDFIDSYIQEAQIYLTQNGIMGIPFTVDPLIMYWNRDSYNAAGIALYPKYWDQFSGLNEKLTVKDQNGNVRKSAIAFGDFTNITNAREILGTLLMQLNNPVTGYDNYGIPVSTLNVNSYNTTIPAVKFFTQFADPADSNYSWNRGMPNDKTSFLSGVLSTYFGFASEIYDIRNKNPNLNFDAAPLPQVRTGGKAATYGRMYGFSILRSSAQPDVAYQTISVLTDPAYLSELAKTMYLPTVLNSLDQTSSDPYIDNFNKAALISKTWIDADPVKSRQILGSMIDSLISGKRQMSEAVSQAADQYNAVLREAVR